MKITFVLPVAGENGGTRVVAIYAEKLLAMGHDVTVVSRVPRRLSSAERLGNLLRGRRTRVSPSRTRFLDPLGTRHIQIDRAGPLLPEDVPDADVIIATWWRTAFEVAILPPEKGKKTYFVQHHEVFPHLPYDLSTGSYYLPLRKITITQWLVDTMAERYGDNNVALVPNGVDCARFHTPTREKNDRPTVGLMYSTVGFKGADVALAAIRKTMQDFPSLHVVSFGAAEPSSDLPLPNSSVFHRLPSDEILRAAYAACDVWLLASRSEGFGLPLLEAMACRCPVVATRTGAAPDLVSEGVNGYLADVEDAEGLAEGLKHVLSLPSEAWHAMSEAAFTTAKEHDWDSSLVKFEATLRDALGQR